MSWCFAGEQGCWLPYSRKISDLIQKHYADKYWRLHFKCTTSDDGVERDCWVDFNKMQQTDSVSNSIVKICYFDGTKCMTIGCTDKACSAPLCPKHRHLLKVGYLCCTCIDANIRTDPFSSLPITSSIPAAATLSVSDATTSASETKEPVSAVTWYQSVDELSGVPAINRSQHQYGAKTHATIEQLSLITKWIRTHQLAVGWSVHCQMENADSNNNNACLLHICTPPPSKQSEWPHRFIYLPLAISPKPIATRTSQISIIQ